MQTSVVLALAILSGLVCAGPRDPCGCRPTFQFCANDYETYGSICEYKCKYPETKFQDWFILYRRPCVPEQEPTPETTPEPMPQIMLEPTCKLIKKSGAENANGPGNGDMNVDITVANELQKVTAKASGESIDIISDQEQNTFKISYKAAAKFMGLEPSNLYLRSPTPWGDLYRSYGWDEIKTELRPVKTTIISLNINPVTIGGKHFMNILNRGNSAKHGEQVSQEILTTVFTTTSTKKIITAGRGVNYKVSFVGGNFAGAKMFYFKHRWGQKTTKTQTAICSADTTTIDLKPRQAAYAVLTANHGTLKVKVEFEVRVSGQVAMNYGQRYRGHHFWATDVNEVLKRSGQPTSFKLKEIITVEFYSDLQLAMYDSTAKQIA